jgi:DNA replication protein DnaC
MPSVNKTLVLELARCEFLARRENVLLLGNSGTSKTHIALALGLAAGHRVEIGNSPSFHVRHLSYITHLHNRYYLPC